MAEWEEVELGSLGTLFDGPHATPKRVAEGPYFLNIASLDNGRLDLGQSDHISRDEFARWTRRVTPAGGDLLFSYETRLGDAALMPDGVEACLGRRMALLRPDPARVDQRFLLYLYLSPAMKRTIDENTIHGATVNRIALSTMGQWRVSVPPLDQQRAIADVLGALDDKIAANTRLATTARALAQAEYRRLVARTDRLTPLGELLDLRYGKALAASVRRPGKVTVYGSGGPVGTHDEALVAGPGVVVGRKGTAGAVHWVPGPHFPIDTTFAAQPKATGLSMIFCYFTLREAHLADMNSDSAVPGLNRAEASAVRVPVPDVALVTRFTEVAEPLFSAADHGQAESESLAATRDALLPALMSGKLRVRDAEQIAEATT